MADAVSRRGFLKKAVGLSAVAVVAPVVFTAPLPTNTARGSLRYWRLTDGDGRTEASGTYRTLPADTDTEHVQAEMEELWLTL